jgi:transaldolase
MPANPRLARLHEVGVSIWLDTLSRELLETGAFSSLVRDYSVTGATSNPTIFAHAITASDRYDEQLRARAAAGVCDVRELFLALALDDVRHAAGLLRSEYDRSHGADGFVSFECTPDVADDTEATIAQARELWKRLARPNVMIKVPGTEAGLAALEQLTREGVNVNVTLLFSVERYEQVIDAYLRGLAARADAGEPVASLRSVASFFLSRIDTAVDGRLPAGSPLRGQVALASARVAYQRYLAKFAGHEWERLEALGAKRQRPLWASTGTKNPEYSDVRYVAELIGPDVVNTMPEHTLRAFADDGKVAATLQEHVHEARQALARLEGEGLSLGEITSGLERDGIRAFCDSYRELLECIADKLAALDGAPRARAVRLHAR